MPTRRPYSWKKSVCHPSPISSAGHNAPHARLSRELITRASTVRTLACDIQRTFQNVRARHQHCNVQPGANACWTLASEMDTILTALRETQSATT